MYDPSIDLYHGDCLAVMPALPEQSVTMICVDPPYGTTECAWDAVIPFTPMWEGIAHVLQPNGVCVFFAGQPFTSALVWSKREWFRYEWIWHKTMATGMMNARYRPLKAHDNILVFSPLPTRANQFTTRRANYFPITTPTYQREPTKTTATAINNLRGSKKTGSYIRTEKDYPRSVLTYPQDRAYKHPTQKPVSLLSYLIRTYTSVGDTVLDFTMGSGSTGVAALSVGRSFVGIEQDADYFRGAEQRIYAADRCAAMSITDSSQGWSKQQALWGDESQ